MQTPSDVKDRIAELVRAISELAQSDTAVSEVGRRRSSNVSETNPFTAPFNVCLVWTGSCW